jgi:predicted DNA-binding antitoxin AbrB/MazE fold protein
MGLLIMPNTLKAVYRNGAFILETACNLPEGSEVELLVQSSSMVSPPISDVESKQRFLKSLIFRMQQNPIPLNAPHFIREMLHERR